MVGDSRPACASRVSVSVVLPWSMWAVMPMFLIEGFCFIRRSMSGVCRKRSGMFWSWCYCV